MAAIVVRDQLRDAERAGREPADVVEPLARLIDDAAARGRVPCASDIRARGAESPDVAARLLSEVLS